MQLKLEALQENVRTLTQLVCDGSLPGLFVVGPGGLGKTHSVLEALKVAGIEQPRVLNTHATARGLFEELFHARNDRVVLMEDLEQLYSSLPALSLLRSVLWGPKTADGRMKRSATWAIAKSGEDGIPAEFEFEAGIIMTANRFPKGEIFASLETRVPVVRFDVAEADVFSFMRQMASAGQAVFDGGSERTHHLSSDDCEVVIRHLERRGATDLRKLHHGLVLFSRFREEGRWKALLDTILQSSAEGADFLADPSEETRRFELRVVADLSANSTLSVEEQVAEFASRTGRSRPTFFRRRQELRKNGSSKG